MSRLSTASGNWLASLFASIGSTRDRTHARPQAAAVRGEIAGVGALSRDACLLPGLFSCARNPYLSGPATESVPAVDAGPGLWPTEHSYQSRSESLAALEHTLRSCRLALTECSPHVPLSCRRRLEDGLRTVETEYVRLCDARRFLVDRQLRYATTGEADDDPEFTAVLERVVYATDPGDDVAASVAQAVQTIVAALLPYVGGVE